MSRTFKSAFESFNEIATIRIELVDSAPLIWREVEVPTSMTLKVLHDVIQAVMGWFDCHLWEFTVAMRKYGLPMDEDWGTEPRFEAFKVRLRDVLAPGKTIIDYIYDFGDLWEHLLTVTYIGDKLVQRGKPRPEKTGWIDPDDVPELTDEMLARADVYEGDTLIRRGRPPKDESDMIV